MDKILCTIYYADDTSIIVTPANNNDLQKEATYF